MPSKKKTGQDVTVLRDIDEADSFISTSEPDEESQASGTSGGHTNTNSDDNNANELNREKEHVQNFASSESQYVRIWRRNVLIVLAMMCTLVTSLTFVFLAREDKEDFETSFELLAQTVLESVEFNIKNVWEASIGVSELLTLEAKRQNMTWPFVTISAFDTYVRYTTAHDNTELMGFSPFVRPDQVQAWNEYSASHQGWIRNGLIFESQRKQAEEREALGSDYQPDTDELNIQVDPIQPIHTSDLTGLTVLDDGSNVYCCGDNPILAPSWQTSPTPTNSAVVNVNLLSIPEYRERVNAIIESRTMTLSRAAPNPALDIILSPRIHAEQHRIPNAEFMTEEESIAITSRIPHTILFLPVFERLHDATAPVVAYISDLMNWDHYLRDILPDNVPEIFAVLRNSCGEVFTFSVQGQDVSFVGEGALIDENYSKYKQVIPMYNYFQQTEHGDEGDCMYVYELYPTSAFQDKYRTNIPIVFALTVAASFVVMALTFFVYDCFVVRKNNKIIDAAAQSSAIVSSMFPSTVRDRLFDSDPNKKFTSFMEETGKTKLSSFLNSSHILSDGDGNNGINEQTILLNKPIADLFPETTVMFADLVGFTAWSSMREPSQVFILLETIYSAFDKIAKRRRIFKVETVGDCYVAVTGLPEPRKDHAVAMARFANECLVKLHDLTRQLEVILGPDTGDLSMRVGLHSGPVTAGVLRGERSRFQLFGDTMNTASRMESTGKAGCIQVSQETADQILSSGKKNWLEKRKDIVLAKGKGAVNTYWLQLNAFASTESTSSSGNVSVDCNNVPGQQKVDTNPIIVDQKIEEKTSRLIQWNVDVLSRLLKQLVARRKCCSKSPKATSLVFEEKVNRGRNDSTPLEEVVDIITLPEFNSDSGKKQAKPEEIDLGALAENELQDYVTSIAMMYRHNPFHNFEHASHVTMSVVKLLSRIVAPIDFQPHQVDEGSKGVNNESIMRTKYEHTLHDHTYGITSDPLTQFSCVLSALVHDADHSGVPNAQLVKEKQSICRLYKDRSVAEQNSVDLAWELLMDPSYSNLRAVIYTEESEMRRFRQLLVNSVMATDIMDKELGAQRKARWNVAFANDASKHLSRQQRTNQKATIVIEHLIQASDVAHTMQHWHIYRKWNERLYTELYKAFVEGRAEKDPAEFWYKGEIGFFDFYIIPLAKKLKDCGVFGVSSDEYLQYAEKNRQEWELKGEQVVSEMSERVRRAYQS